MSEQPQAYTIKTPTAKKEHLCCECRGTISVGEKYHLFSGVWDGTAGTYKTCEECEQLRKDVSAEIKDYEDHPAFGGLYEHVFESQDHDWVKRFMDTRRKRNAPESPRGWMERRESQMLAVS